MKLLNELRFYFLSKRILANRIRRLESKLEDVLEELDDCQLTMIVRGMDRNKKDGVSVDIKDL